MSNFVIQKGSTNSVALTLSERSQVTSPWYLMVFTNKFSTSLVEEVCSLRNTIEENIRFDLLSIVENESPDPLLGEVNLIEGEWYYEVYESVNQVLEVSDTTGRILQRGFIIVK